MLSESQTQFRETARALAQRELAGGAAQRDRDEAFPHDAFLAMAKAGLMGIMVDPEFDGVGADYVSFSQVVTEIAYADGAASTALQVHNGLVCMSLQNFGSHDQKNEFLRPLALGDRLGCFCLTEPEAGSDAGAIQMRAERRGNHFVLNGSKQFITSGKNANTAIVFAVTDKTKGKKGLSAFIVPTSTEGYKVARIEQTMGQRSTDHCHLVFENCEVPAANMLGEEGEGLKIALSGLAGGRIGVAAQALGMARSAYDRAVSYARERRTFGKPIMEHQAVGFRLAEMATQIQAAEMMVWRAASLRDENVECLKEASMAKLFATEMAERVCHDALQTLGGYGYLADFEIERIYRDVRVCKIYEGTSDIQKLVISRIISR
jgi:alkylation response protein AidB-like acyl-CoA dehydrogenase